MSSACRTLRLHALVIRATCCVLLIHVAGVFSVGQEAKEPAAAPAVEAKPAATASTVESKPAVPAPIEAKPEAKPAARAATGEAGARLPEQGTA